MLAPNVHAEHLLRAAAVLAFFALYPELPGVDVIVNGHRVLTGELILAAAEHRILGAHHSLVVVKAVFIKKGRCALIAVEEF